MEIKKNPEADLERRSGLFLNIGLCISLILVIAAFEWRSYDRGAAMDLGSIDDVYHKSIKFYLEELYSEVLENSKKVIRYSHGIKWEKHVWSTSE